MLAGGARHRCSPAAQVRGCDGTNVTMTLGEGHEKSAHFCQARGRAVECFTVLEMGLERVSSGRTVASERRLFAPPRPRPVFTRQDDHQAMKSSELLNRY